MQKRPKKIDINRAGREREQQKKNDHKMIFLLFLFFLRICFAVQLVELELSDGIAKCASGAEQLPCSVTHNGTLLVPPDGLIKTSQLASAAVWRYNNDSRKVYWSELMFSVSANSIGGFFLADSINATQHFRASSRQSPYRH